MIFSAENKITCAHRFLSVEIDSHFMLVRQYVFRLNERQCVLFTGVARSKICTHKCRYSRIWWTRMRPNFSSCFSQFFSHFSLSLSLFLSRVVGWSKSALSVMKISTEIYIEMTGQFIVQWRYVSDERIFRIGSDHTEEKSVCMHAMWLYACDMRCSTFIESRRMGNEGVFIRPFSPSKKLILGNFCEFSLSKKRRNNNNSKQQPQPIGDGDGNGRKLSTGSIINSCWIIIST